MVPCIAGEGATARPGLAIINAIRLQETWHVNYERSHGAPWGPDAPGSALGFFRGHAFNRSAPAGSGA